MSEIKGLADAIERGAMTAPRTAAGRAMLADPLYAHAGGYILAIEAEADRSLLLDAALRALVGVIAARPCLATEFYVEGYPEVLPKSALMDGVERCLDTEYNEMGSGEDQWPWDKPLERCDPCAARAALAATDVRGVFIDPRPGHCPHCQYTLPHYCTLAAKGVER